MIEIDKTPESSKDELVSHFEPFRQGIIGSDKTISTHYGEKKLIYADWTASGRQYQEIEDKMIELAPYVANTHTETTTTGSAMTLAYHEARNIIKKHVHAAEEDVLILEGTGMTGAISKFQRILGLRIPEQLSKFADIPKENRPVVFVTHMEHHSNHTSWLETISEVVLIPHSPDGLIDLKGFEEMISMYTHHPMKIASVSAASNVTGIRTPYHEIAAIIHKKGGVCFVDFACSAPYVSIDMHPAEEGQSLDAIFFSPHKFLGGPGTPGVLIFNKKLYKNLVPDRPGGGTVDYTNPWGDRHYYDNIEMREDGGTPGFLQAIRAAMSVKLKEKMGVEQIEHREQEINRLVFSQLDQLDNVVALADQHRDRLSIFSFYIVGVHFNLVVRLLNDRFGIQTRGGCSCAGTYGHFLLHVDQATSKEIADKIYHGNLSDRPGWIRASFHPTMTDEEVNFVCDAIKQVAENAKKWEEDYAYDPAQNEYKCRVEDTTAEELVRSWFEG